MIYGSWNQISLIGASHGRLFEENSARLPLADGTLSLLSWVLEPGFLGEVFKKYRGRSYESELSFSNMVSLIQDALLEHAGSAIRR